MKALFLIFHGLAGHSGISKKILSQRKALEKCGLSTVLCYLDTDEKGNIVRKIDENILENFGKGVCSTLRKLTCYEALYDYILKEKIGFLYIRSFHNANPFLNRMLRKLKKKGLKTVIEVPTYPYDDEHKNDSLKEKFYFLVHQCCRKKMAYYSDGIVTFSNYKEIDGQKTIPISNGIDFDDISLKNSLNDTSKILHLVGVAEINFWHGYDRLIEGLSIYYKTLPERKVIFHIVGEGERFELDKLKRSVEEKNLSAYVVFHGSLSGKALDEIFETSDLGIASLARHRSHITHIKTLKNREYAARGIPFIYSEIDSDFENRPYILKIPADESAVDIENLLRFYDSIDKTPEKIRASVRSLDWKVQMQKVLNQAFPASS